MLMKNCIILIVLLLSLAENGLAQATPPAAWGPDQVRSLVLQWFSLQDGQAPAKDFVPLLDPQGFEFNFSNDEPVVTTQEGFFIWYHGFLKQFPNGTHELINLKVVPTDQGFDALMDVDFTSANGYQVSSFERWQVRDSGGSPVVHKITFERRY